MAYKFVDISRQCLRTILEAMIPCGTPGVRLLATVMIQGRKRRREGRYGISLCDQAHVVAFNGCCRCRRWPHGIGQPDRYECEKLVGQVKAVIEIVVWQKVYTYIAALQRQARSKYALTRVALPQHAATGIFVVLGYRIAAINDKPQ